MNNNQFVIFRLEEEFYGIKIDYVETIERMMPITRVPKAPNYVKGVINLRGEIVPIIDLRERLNIEFKEYGSDTRIIVNKMKEMMIGYIVDSASEVKEIEPSMIDYATFDDASSDTFVKGIGKIDDTMIIILDVDKIVEK
ncbi:purine-binding chemotaxis protein CheW [Acetoanaerobium pronyense]|uniref:Purine-binding chemotaxis protein CheW n=1 Tax=Acetoanaerobium pronyense TaxID=1482736 RepID=A0ABS4KGM7_9FIRM|nr:chemotaxis protein CheW [Acetoanaerobium pronyense]MBP2026421.1 purine-binding chemotaxis protein CheW [Acetoanaerobium pronyense]